MKISVPEELVTLAEIFRKNKEKLYLVGGYVRNKILRIPDSYNLDIDVCSSARPEKIIKMLKQSGFEVSYMNEELGVLEIKNKIRVEHATFRREKYPFSGVHIPNNVEFIKDIEEDAKRRDFRCNALYYDILEDELIDPLDGLKDIENKIIRTTLDPKEVFKNDAERILRMVRFACTFAFDIDKETLQEAMNNVDKLKFISQSRKREEFSKIVLADTRYDFLADVKYAHARGIGILASMGALKYLLPSLERIRTSGIIEDKGKPLFQHILNVFAISDPTVRLSALMHDCGKAVSFLRYRNFNGSQEFALIEIENDLGTNGLNYPKKVVERVKKVVLGYDFNKLGLNSAKNIRRFIIDNSNEIELIINLKNAVSMDKSNMEKKSFSATRMQKIYTKMEKSNAPFQIADLKITGDDVIENIPDIKPQSIGLLLKSLLYKCGDHPSLNKKESLLKIAKSIVKRNKDDYLEV